MLICLLSLIMGACKDDKNVFVEVPSEFLNLDFDARQDRRTIKIDSDGEWRLISSDPSWCTTSHEIGENEQYVNVYVTRNFGSEDRTATLTLTASGSEKVVINVKQKMIPLADESGWESAFVASRNMKVGCNLYNTLDAAGTWFDPDDIVTCETCWGQPLTDQEWFDALYRNGFRCVRVPVTWWLHMDENWNVKEPWMARVEEVVNYALNAGLYCILNVHHDTGANDGSDPKNQGGWLSADLDNMDDISAKFESLWTQIANRFNKYGEKLLFEGYNEMLDAKDSWVEPIAGGYEGINILAQKFVDTVRSTGGNNAHRNLIVNTYGAGGSKTRLDNFEIPVDNVGGHLLLEVHNYTPAVFSNLEDKTPEEFVEEFGELPKWTPEYEAVLGGELDLLIDYSNKNNIPIIIGECGAHESIADEEKAKYGKFITSYPKGKADIIAVYWAGGQMIDRVTKEKNSPLFVDAFIEGAQ